MRRFAEFVLRHRALVAVGWLLLAIAGGAAVGPVNKHMTIDFFLPGQPGTEAAHKIISDFGNGGNSSPYLVVLTAPAGQRVTGHEAEVAASFAAVATSAPHLRLVDEATSGSKVFRSKDDTSTYGMLFYSFGTDPSAKPPTPAITDSLKQHAPAGWTTGVTGEDVLAVGDSNSNGPGVFVELLIGALGALIVLAFVFASFLALLPMVVAAGSILLTFLMLLPITYATNVSVIVQFLVALIGLGVAIDYSLLLVTRWREERDHGRDNHEAVVVAMQTAGKAVVFSGVTVAIGLIALLVLPVPFMRSIGLGGALIPLASVFTTLTLTPVILGSIGPKVDWPKIRHENTASKVWSRWATAVVRRRWVAAGTGVVVLGAFILAFTQIKIGQANSASLAHGGPAYTALQTLTKGGEPSGTLTPLQVLTTTGGAQSAAADLAKVSGIDTVVVSTDPANNRNGHTVVVAIPKEETVNSKSVGPVREARSVASKNPAILGIAGLGADQIDFLHGVYGNFPLMLAIIAILTFILLARAFRSVLLPLKAVLLNMLTLGATLGFMVLFWQKGYGSDSLYSVHSTGAVTFWVPMMVFAFLFGLSMDYEVFILARIREEKDEHGATTDSAVIEGIARTGRLVTSAALILFLAFIALSSGPNTDLKLFSTALGFGILLDATIVRSLLVPALISLFGEWNWYMPSWCAKVLRIREPHAGPVPALAD
ncbi:MAG: MmpL protein [Frankiales bacterium]|nr:MmpL protein [Frankiales bacterium]